ncbi:MAG: hypothetical protein WD045_04050, partial [Pirellulaceae bacterium]
SKFPRDRVIEGTVEIAPVGLLISRVSWQGLHGEIFENRRVQPACLASHLARWAANLGERTSLFNYRTHFTPHTNGLSPRSHVPEKNFPKNNKLSLFGRELRFFSTI